ncbi:MAG TPA: signal peptidase I [bacterium]|nr:signal peptidase I [bacterium]
MKIYIRILIDIILVVFLFLVGYFFIYKEMHFVKIISSSMEPTICVGDRVITVKKGVVQRGDIVVIEAPKGKKELLTKRVIGLPSEILEIKDGSVFINRKKLEEPYIKEHPRYELKVKIPEKKYFLLGDNRNKSEDSSIWGPVDEENIKGKVICRYWPLKNFSIF